MYGIASSRSSHGRFYCLERKRGFIIKFREVKMIFFLGIGLRNFTGYAVTGPLLLGLERLW
jgi:hypothetical protein